MNRQRKHISNGVAPWHWPIHLDAYDRNPALSDGERTALDGLFCQPHGQIRGSARTVLSRLLQPIDDLLTSLHVQGNGSRQTVRLLCLEMDHRGTAFWGWTVEQWCESMTQSTEAFIRHYGWCLRDGRTYLPVLAYLCCPQVSIDPLLHLVELYPLAVKVFGKEAIEEAARPITTILHSWGYGQKDAKAIRTCLCYLLLRNRSPFLDDLTDDLVEETAQTCSHGTVLRYLYRVSRALVAHGSIQKALPPGNAKKPALSGADGSMHEEWLTFCQRWRQRTTQQRPDNIYYLLLMVGRWLKVHHPEVTNPAQWTYELAAEFIAAVNEMKVGEWSDATQRSRTAAGRLGQPLRPRMKVHMLKAMRTFLRDCQEWNWIPRSLNPDRALRTPRALLHLSGPNPRVIDSEFWAKILWAAMNLEAKDLPVAVFNTAPAYPLEMVRAIAVVWCFAALRSDEIWRLRVGCMKWQYEDVMVPETGELLPHDAVCFLEVPVNKTSMAYTKPVHPLVGKRINEWERVRPTEQLRALDRKTNETVQFLFSYRGRLTSKRYITGVLIPLLCRKAGIPEQDSRGKITSHRARATIASQLYNAKEPLSILELKEYLGHKYLSSTQNYLGVHPNNLATKVAKAGYLEQNLATIEVLLDQDAVLSGAASRGEPWKFYDLGHGWCTNPFWSSCSHRMACARCPYYRPKQALSEQLVEGKANLVHMLEFVQLTEDEKLLVTEGIELHQALIEKLADVPTPAGPTPRELEAQRHKERKVIPLKPVQRTQSRRQDEQ